MAVALASALGLAPVGAVERIPSEDAAILAGDTYAAMVGDVDGDGRRELVRLLPWETNPGRLALEVVSMRDGGPIGHGQALVQRAASVEDYASGNIATYNDYIWEKYQLGAKHGGGSDIP